MLTPDTLNRLIKVKKEDIKSMLDQGTPNTPTWVYAIKKSRFLGMTNGGEFCYGLEYDARFAERTYQAGRPNKVFVSLDPTTGNLVASV